MPEPSQDLVTRLSRIEGQIAALKRSLAGEARIDCAQTLIQTKAAINGLKRFAEAFARTHAQRCVSEKTGRAQLAGELDTIISSAFTLS